MPAYLEVNTMIFDSQNSVYKYNIDYIKENMAMFNMMTIDISNINPNETEWVFDIKTDSMTEKSKVYLDISDNPALYMADGSDGNDDLFSLLSANFSDEIFSEYEETTNYLQNETSLSTADILAIIQQKQETKAYNNYITNELKFLKATGVVTENGFKTSKGGQLMFNKIEPIDYLGNTTISTSEKNNAVVSNPFAERVFIKLPENSWNFYKSEKIGDKLFTKWHCVKSADLSANGYKGEYNLIVEDENGNPYTLQTRDENGNFTNSTIINFQNIYSGNTRNYYIRVTNTDTVFRTVTFGSVFENENSFGNIFVTINNGMIQMEGVGDMNTSGGIATLEKRTVYTNVFDLSFNHTYEGDDRPYVLNPFYKSFTLPNSDLSGVIRTDPITSHILINDRPLYQYSGDNGPDDANGIPHTRHFRPFDYKGDPIPPISAEEAISIGDPYIQPFLGPTIKLPNSSSNYCLYYCPEFYITASVAPTGKEHRQRIKDFHRSHPLGLNQENLVLDGFFYSFFLIYCSNETILVDLKRKKIIRSHPKKSLFDYSFQYNVCDMEIYKGMKCTEHIFSFHTKERGKVCCGIQFYKHPQIDSGIRLKMGRNFSKGIGLLARNYKPKLMEIPKLHQFNPAKIRKKIKKTKHKYTQKGIYAGGEMWKSIHSR